MINMDGTVFHGISTLVRGTCGNNINNDAKWNRATDRVDEWLDGLGLYRKHIARDFTSLFRCVAEKVYYCQFHYKAVKEHCKNFAIFNLEQFEKIADITPEKYMTQLLDSRQPPSNLDIYIMSSMYKITFVIYNEVNSNPIKISQCDECDHVIRLFQSHENHYDCIYTKSEITNLAMNQSVAYNHLYKNSFQLQDVDYAVQKMLHNKLARYDRETNYELSHLPSQFKTKYEMRNVCKNMRKLLNMGITPFPYRVAKALDPNLYRNVEYDIWNEGRRCSKHRISEWDDSEIKVGSYCNVKITVNKKVTIVQGYVQEMLSDKEPVLLFITQLGHKMAVPFEDLELVSHGRGSGNKVHSNIKISSPVSTEDYLTSDLVGNKYSQSKSQLALSLKFAEPSMSIVTSIFLQSTTYPTITTHPTAQTEITYSTCLLRPNTPVLPFGITSQKIRYLPATYSVPPPYCPISPKIISRIDAQVSHYGIPGVSESAMKENAGKLCENKIMGRFHHFPDGRCFSYPPNDRADYLNVLNGPNQQPVYTMVYSDPATVVLPRRHSATNGFIYSHPLFNMNE